MKDITDTNRSTIATSRLVATTGAVPMTTNTDTSCITDRTLAWTYFSLFTAYVTYAPDTAFYLSQCKQYCFCSGHHQRGPTRVTFKLSSHDSEGFVEWTLQPLPALLMNYFLFACSDRNILPRLNLE